jgi:peptidylprolyl isomerase
MLRSRVPTLLVALALGAATFAAAGCGSSDDEEANTTSGSATTTTSTTDTSDTTAPAPDVASVPAVSHASDLEQKPTIAKPAGSPPATLVTKDLVTGTGPAAASGDKVTLQYVGVSFSNGEQFDASWDTGQPITFTLGAGEVIPGWDQGIVGMQAGGRRVLVIPPDLGYGATGQGPILPNETLVFVVDLKKIG